MTSTMTKIPGIGDIPILGYLFRSKAAQKNRTELVVMITPHLMEEGSPGVTRELPRQREPYLSPLQDNEAIAPPPPAFPQSNLAAPPAGLAGAAEAPGLSAQAVPAPLVVDSGTPQLTADERRAAERARKADEERAEAEARAQAKAEAEERKRQEKLAKEQEKLAKEQEKLAKEQAKRDAEEGRRKAEADRRAAEQAAKQAEADRKKQAAIDAAAEKVRAAEAAYQAELAKTGTTK
jgi:hypothetical protein